jgi:hypothetical protein
MKSPSDILIRFDGVDISDRVVYAQSWFEQSANPVQGSFQLVCRDMDQDFEPVIGKKVTCHIDGKAMGGGYGLRIARGNFFPAVETNPPGGVRSRKWTITGPDFNVMFDKRVLHDPADHFNALTIPESRRTLSGALTYLFDNFVDTIPGLGYSTHVDDIDVVYSRNKGLYVQQGSTLRAQMDDFVKWGAVIYYIDADLELHFHEYENIGHPWSFVDAFKNGVTTIGFREGAYEEDFTSIVTDALVWGGSAIAPPGPAGDVVFARYPDPPVADKTVAGRLQSAAREQAAIDRRNLYGRWQMAEMNIGQENYLLQESVDQRAYTIINGPSGAVPTYGLEGGFSQPTKRMTAAWYAHDVPDGDHVRAGEITDFILYTQGPPGNPLIARLPLRSVRMSFPTIPGDNPAAEPLTFVRFDGEFGTSYSDSRHLWKFLKQTRRLARRNVTAGPVTITPGATAAAFPVEDTDGSRTVFTFEGEFVYGESDLYLNGLLQAPGVSYTATGSNEVTMVLAPDASDTLYATGLI